MRGAAIVASLLPARFPGNQAARRTVAKPTPCLSLLSQSLGDWGRGHGYMSRWLACALDHTRSPVKASRITRVCVCVWSRVWAHTSWCTEGFAWIHFPLAQETRARVSPRERLPLAEPGARGDGGVSGRGYRSLVPLGLPQAHLSPWLPCPLPTPPSSFSSCCSQTRRWHVRAFGGDCPGPSAQLGLEEPVGLQGGVGGTSRWGHVCGAQDQGGCRSGLGRARSSVVVGL